MSGPRWTMRSIMLVSTCSLFSTSPVNPTNPHIGHLSFVWHSIKADKSLKSEFYRACAPSRESSLKRLMPPLFARARKRPTLHDRGNDRIGNRKSNWLRRDRGSHQGRQPPKPRGLASKRAESHERRRPRRAPCKRHPCTMRTYDAARAPRHRPRTSAPHRISHVHACKRPARAGLSTFT